MKREQQEHNGNANDTGTGDTEDSSRRTAVRAIAL
ncbi:hypothetical protein PF008_g8827 [Phytophthora fragariae]|uniref:Uncharacterized protein n=1 Tax=Phytophthora fragariae TaxID=53985 RepID=A0A6G0RYM6_9STRA|nr:hypothetical protein PF008_g8827 [Phytophthora fragariae]